MPDPTTASSNDPDDASQPLISSDDAHEPLIPQAVRSTAQDADATRAPPTAAPPPADERSATPGLFIWGLTLSACISGLLFGFDTGVISATLVSVGADLSARPLSTLDKALVTAATALFALLAAPGAAALADAAGRRRVVLVADVLFVVGALAQAAAAEVWVMVVGRAVVGLAVGSASFVVPLYIGELAPATWRGRLVTIVALFITGGQVVAYVIGWLFSRVPGGWRWMVGLGAAPAIVQLCTLVFMPETPRWLIKHGDEDHARLVLRKVYGNDQEAIVKSIMMRVEKEIEEEEAAVSKTIRHSTTSASGFRAHIIRMTDNFYELAAVPGYRRALIISCLLQGAQQLCGFVTHPF